MFKGISTFLVQVAELGYKFKNQKFLSGRKVIVISDNDSEED